jgi:hypothetical protein
VRREEKLGAGRGQRGIVCDRRAIDRKACARQRLERGVERRIAAVRSAPVPASSSNCVSALSSERTGSAPIIARCCPPLTAAFAKLVPGHNAGAETFADRYDLANVHKREGSQT